MLFMAKLSVLSVTTHWLRRYLHHLVFQSLFNGLNMVGAWADRSSKTSSSTSSMASARYSTSKLLSWWLLRSSSIPAVSAHPSTRTTSWPGLIANWSNWSMRSTASATSRTHSRQTGAWGIQCMTEKMSHGLKLADWILTPELGATAFVSGT